MTQNERRERTRSALLESAARGISRYGYSNLNLAQVARDAGYTRGALYHLFKDKQELTLATINWVMEAWEIEVEPLVKAERDPMRALLALARGHARFCRRDIARAATALRIEFNGQDHPIGHAIESHYAELVATCVAYIDAARDNGSIPIGPPSDVLALGYVGAIDGTVIALAGRAPYDEELTVLAVAGVLGIEHKDTNLDQGAPT